MRSRRLPTILTWAATLIFAWLLAACGGSSPATSGANESASTDPSPAATATSHPIEGIWRTDLTRKQMKANLEKFGLEKWADQFFDVEEIDKDASWVWVFGDDRFSGYWLYPDGSWRVGWTGPLTVAGGEVSLEDEEYFVTDTFRYTLDGDELTFEFVRTEGSPEVKGIPEEVYLRAYFTQPLKRATCPPEAGLCHA